MFYASALLSIIAYSVMNLGLMPLVRKYDTLTVSTIRSLSLSISMLPLLFLGVKDSPVDLPTLFPLAISGALGGCTAFLGFYSLRLLPVGIKSCFENILKTLLFAGIGFWLWQEILTPAQITLIAIMMLGTIFMFREKYHSPHIEVRMIEGIGITVLNNILLVISMVLVIQVSNKTNPFWAAYWWESFIGVFSLLFLLIRHFTTRHKIKLPPLPIIIKTILWSSLTLIGTGGMYYAASIGPMSIVSAIAMSGIFINAALGHFWHGEKVTHRQWILFGVMIGVLALFKSVT